ncbi:hypothetical protein I6N90_07910 [Paenibacillus sp. GSMTC-2017]|uniref:DUF6080 domain-containing protein n=1 Tax=Paenibacillus sp. GSMTC-2017 TaxID=2794350 RepID=UPI0018D6A298|nr:DUF6080 domain-containing protein [Paenibacillus sp. GSMTC-2017]MBH5317726.1 hypothetical protein [Paenibacillus sp. GSMTC-2017]
MNNLIHPHASTKFNSFAAFLFHNRRDNVVAAVLFFCFSALYIFMNIPFLSYMEQNAKVLSQHSPFYGAPFFLNIFNFDPSFYYGFLNMTVIHPFMSLLSGNLYKISELAGGNLFFLFVQSALNALSAVLIYYYLRRRGDHDGQVGIGFPFWFASFFGVSSYTIFTAMIPDSYGYAQFVIILSVLYLAYVDMGSNLGKWPAATLAFLNFGITLTNIVTYFGALFVTLFTKKYGQMIRPIIRISVYFIILIVIFSGMQLLLFDGKSWFNNMQQNLENGGFTYAAPFSFAHHWKAVYMLFISPILTPDMTLINPGIVAFATNLSQPYPIYVTIIGFALLALAIAGFVRGIRTKEAWTMAVYIGFAIALHLVVGYGLAVFEYDLYLYAGHYLFAVFLLAASFLMGMKRGKLRMIGMIFIITCTIVTLGNNVIKHNDSLQVIKESYVQLGNKEVK